MAGLKTKKNKASVGGFLDSIDDETKRNDCREIAGMMQKAIGCEPAMWGTSIVGFGGFDLKYKSGRKADWFRIGFSPRVQGLTLYIMNGFERYDELMSELGKHTTGKSCLYIKRLSDVDKDVLNELIVESLEFFENKYGPNKG